ncbi:hypothetical protein FHETE_7643 [Fusarium heterosporum]|uniref:DUF4440 domain-containing protein n=1 Tax=Fusarium heterosporum TaxID=42747 RepID=A0A8H5WKB6_FUSHE|nr:hypothetical protein FHETE_7643 [Fusarium heterosporum]
MPTMLGLTNDKSPHGINAEDSKFGGPSGQRSMQLTPSKNNGSIVSGIEGSDFFNGGAKQNEHDADEDDSDDENLKTIKGRNLNAVKEMETLLWRALCDKPKSALKYIAKDAVMSNRYLFGDPVPRTADSDPSLEEEIKHCEEWLAYKMQDPQPVEIGLMAAAVGYKLILFRQIDQGNGNFGMQTIQATCSSSWRQLASGDWELTSMFAG